MPINIPIKSIFKYYEINAIMLRTIKIGTRTQTEVTKQRLIDEVTIEWAIDEVTRSTDITKKH